MEYLFIKEAIKPSRPKGQAAGITEEWLETDNKTLQFKCKNEAELKSLKSAIYAYRKAHNYDYTVWTDKGTLAVYLIRA